MIVEPLHTAEIAGRAVRFFRSPLQGPDLPWISLDDVLLAAFPAEFHEDLLRRVRDDWPKVARSVATSAGLTTICPQSLGDGMFHAAEANGFLPRDGLARFNCAAGDATAEALKHLPVLEKMRYVLAASAREHASG